MFWRGDPITKKKPPNQKNWPRNGSLVRGAPVKASNALWLKVNILCDVNSFLVWVVNWGGSERPEGTIVPVQDNVGNGFCTLFTECDVMCAAVTYRYIKFSKLVQADLLLLRMVAFFLTCTTMPLCCTSTRLDHLHSLAVDIQHTIISE